MWSLEASLWMSSSGCCVFSVKQEARSSAEMGEGQEIQRFKGRAEE